MATPAKRLVTAVVVAARHSWASLLCAAALVALLLGQVGLAHAAQPIALDDAQPEVQVWPMVTILDDPQKNITIAQILETRPAFKVPNTAYGTLGMRKDAVWLRIPVSVPATGSGLWVLDIDYPPINRIDLYVVNDKNIEAQGTTGNLVARAKKPVDSRANSFALTLKPGSVYDLYLRVENKGAMILPITLSKPVAFHARTLNEQMLQGLLTGLALCLLVYSLGQWVNLGEHLFVKYAILISGSLMFSLLQFGVGAQFIWGDSHWMELHVGGLSAMIAATGSFLFIEQALAGDDMKPWLSKLMRFGAALMVFFAFCYAMDWLDVEQVTLIVSTLGLAPSLLGLPGALRRARRGDSVGVYFLLAWAVYFVTTAILIEVIKGTVGANFWTLHSFQFGATFDMLLFMRVLGLRTKALQMAVLTAKTERDRLQILAHTDPLTGLPNRRSLHSAISAAIKDATHDKLLAVYMLDLDGFKQVNDQNGHDVGDELLIAVAKRLKDSLRSSDVISRLGGDEFLVMSRDLQSERQARELGEKMLRAFDDAFLLTTQSVHVGMTIGYALAPLDSQDTAKLLKLADAAMYAGKQSGKNCLKRGDSEGILA
jgi:diguanylate cyclase